MYIQSLKERIQYGVLMNNYVHKNGSQALDRIVPLPGFDFEEFPYILVNNGDVMDLKTGDIIFKLSELKTQFAFWPIDKSDLLLTYKDDVLNIQKLVQR